MAQKSGLKKKDHVQFFVNSLTEEQWELIGKMRGAPEPSTLQKKYNLISKIFKKTAIRISTQGKARNLQQWVCTMISGITGLLWGADEDIASREMGQAGVDVRLTQLARSLFPFSVECKDSRKWNLPQAIEQAKYNMYPGTNWLLILRKTANHSEDKTEAIACLDAEVFFGLASRLVKLVRRPR